MAAERTDLRRALLGRTKECEELDRLLDDVRAGQSRVSVVRGEPGMGKTAMLDYVSDRATGTRVLRANGVESEMELDYSGLHQLCGPLLEHLEHLPGPQEKALATVFALNDGQAPDGFLVGLATLTLFAEVAEHEPLVCVVDDAHWLDKASARTLGFVARRLLAERIAIVCGARTGLGDHVLAGLDELQLRGLGDSDARALLLDNLRGPLDAAVCDQIVTESHGNPLALLELPRTWSHAALAGGFGLPDGTPVAGKIEQSYGQRLQLLPDETRLLILVAAVEPLGDPLLLQRAADSLGIEMTAADAAMDAGLLDIGGRVTFTHPLVRSAASRAASARDRHRVHRALADATDPATDPDRRAWHSARAISGPDDKIAADLERSAGRAQARGGLAAAAAFLQRSTALTKEPADRGRRALDAAQASLGAGALDAALSLVQTAETVPLGEVEHARADLLHAQIAFAQERVVDAPELLLTAAQRFETIDVEAARDIYLDAISAGVLLGRTAGRVGVQEVARSALAAPKRSPPRAADLLLDGFATRFLSGYAAAAPLLKDAVGAYVDGDVPDDEAVRRLWLACHAAWHLWDDRSWQRLAARHLELARNSGALADLPFALSMRSAAHISAGELDLAGMLNDERQALVEAIGSRFPPFADLSLAAWRGGEPHAAEPTETAAATEWGRTSLAEWARAVRLNGLGQHDEALAAATRAIEGPDDLVASNLGLIELIMAAARTGATGEAERALARLTEIATASGTDWALGIHARSSAQVARDDPDPLYREAVDRLGRTAARSELGRTHLIYGEWLRRQGRRSDARSELRIALDVLDAVGAHALVERARHELAATGETVRKRRDETRADLTPQERQIAQLARDGLSNPEIGARLFLSPRTVEWHLRKVFTKLGVTSRRQLRSVLGESPQPVGTR